MGRISCEGDGKWLREKGKRMMSRWSLTGNGEIKEGGRRSFTGVEDGKFIRVWGVVRL